MNLPDIRYIRESPVGSGSESPVGSGGGGSEGDQRVSEGASKRFAMVPWEVGIDGRLIHLDVRVYFVLAACRRGNRVKIGTRLLATYSCTSQRRVIESLKRLAECGYLKAKKDRLGFRSEYELTSQVLMPERSPEVESIQPAVAIARSQSPTCPRCQTKCRQLLKAGHCRRCRWKDSIIGIVRDEIKRTG